MVLGRQRVVRGVCKPSEIRGAAGFQRNNVVSWELIEKRSAPEAGRKTTLDRH